MRILIEAANAVVAVEEGNIVEGAGTFRTIVRVPEGEVRVGLVNSHDHLHRNHYGRLGTPPYANAYAWARDIQVRHHDVIAHGRALPRRNALLTGAWKNLLAGVTRVVHHDVWEKDFEIDFPLSVVRLDTADSLGMTSEIPSFAENPFALHVAEGVDASAAEEIRILERRGLLTAGLLAVHAVGADADGIARLSRGRCGLVWCPTSNIFLFGKTVPSAFLSGAVDVLLGTDSLLTADGTMLDELRVARTMISDDRLLGGVGDTAARRLGIAPGGLAIGSRADLVVSRRPILESRADDILLVMADGALRVLAPELAEQIGPKGGQITKQSGVARWISQSPS